MAVGTLSTKKLINPGRTGGLKANTIRAGAGMSISAPKVNPNAGQINFQPANIPKTIQDPTKEGALHFADVLAKSAFAYQERESTFFADEAITKFTQSLSNNLNGYQDSSGEFFEGVLSSRGASSIAAYEKFDKTSEADMAKALSSMEPRVRQKATIGMLAAKNRYTNQAAKHRVQELAVAETIQKKADRNSMVTEFSKDPTLIYEADPTTGMTGKDRMRKLFDSDAEFDIAWGSAVHDIGKAMYEDYASRGKYNEAMNAVKGYYNVFAQDELSNDIATNTAFLSDIRGWEMQTTKYQNYLDGEERRAQQRDKEDKYDQGYSIVTQNLASNTILTQEVIGQMEANGYLPANYASNYITEYYGEGIKTRPEDFDRVTEGIEDGTITTFAQIGAEKYLTPGQKENRRAYMEKVKLPEFNNRLKTGLGIVDTWFKGGFLPPGLTEAQFETSQDLAKNRMRDLLQANPQANPYDIAAKLYPEFNLTQLAWNDLPETWGSSQGHGKPNTMEAVNTERKILEASLASENGISSEEYFERSYVLALYEGVLKTGGNQSNISVGEGSGLPDQSGTDTSVDPDFGATPLQYDTGETKSMEDTEAGSDVKVDKAAEQVKAQAKFEKENPPWIVEEVGALLKANDVAANYLGDALMGMWESVQQWSPTRYRDTVIQRKEQRLLDVQAREREWNAELRAKYIEEEFKRRVLEGENYLTPGDRQAQRLGLFDPNNPEYVHPNKVQ